MECMEICTKHTNYRIHCDDDGWALGVSTEYCFYQSFNVCGDKKQRREMSRLKDNLERSQHVNVHCELQRSVMSRFTGKTKRSQHVNVYWELQRRNNVVVHRQNTKNSKPEPISLNTEPTHKA